MNYILDSDVVNIIYDDQRNGHEHIHRKTSALRDEDRLFISVLILYELEYSFFNAPDDKKDYIRNTINCVTNEFDGVLPLEQKSAGIFGELKTLLRKRKNLTRKEMRKHNIDIMLAGTAISNSCVMVGTDSIYEDIAELNPMFCFENWLT